jgi:hypothetical protein
VNTRHLLRQTLTLAAALLLYTGASHAGLYHVTINTSALIDSPNAPFSLDFQFNDGGVLGNNTATIYNFNYGTGSAAGSATLVGGAAGNIASTVTLNNSDAAQELYQSFTPGATLSFDLSLTQNLDGTTPDAFLVAILDKDLFNIPTNSSFLDDTLLHADIKSTNPLTILQLNLSSGTGEYANVTVLAAVPEPETYAMLLAGLGLLGFAAKYRRKTRLSVS